MSNLTREQKLELIAALEEKKRRELLKKPIYVPNKGQLQFHKSPSANRFNLSGNSAGKSTALVNELAWILQGYNPILDIHYKAGKRVAVVLDNTRKVEEVILAEFRKWHDLPDAWVKKEGKPTVSKLVNDRVEISFYSVESSPSLFEGTTLSDVYVDEPIPKYLYIALMRSLRSKQHPGRFTFVGTPISAPWLRTDIYEPWVKGELPNTEVLRWSTYDNIQNLNKDGVDSFARALSPEEKKTRLEGAFFDADAQALAHLWKRDIHIVKQQDLDWKKEWPCVVGLDPHYSKPHIAVLVGATPSNKQIVLKELSLKLTAREFAYALIEFIEGYRVIDIVCDSLGSAEMTGNEGFNSFIDVLNQELRAKGKPGVRATTYADKSHEAAIDRLQTGLLVPTVKDNFGMAIPKLRVMENCRGLIDNIETVGWQKNRLTGEIKPKLDTSTKDYLSALCYALAANVHFKRGDDRPVYMSKSPYAGIKLKSQLKPQRAVRQSVDEDW